MPAPDIALKEILDNLRQGRETERCFRIVFERYYRRVFHFFRKRGVPEEDARDLTQEVFFAVYKDVGGLRDVDRFESWLFTLTRNVLHRHLDWIGAKKRAEPTVAATRTGEDGVEREVLDLVQDPQKDPLAQAIDREKASLLHRELLKLPPQMRQCVVMRVAEDALLEQIAMHMKISLNTVKAHLHQARRILRKRLEPEFGPFDFTGEKGDEER